MASEEEVDITIRTVADTSGAQQVQSALNGLQQAASQAQATANSVSDAMNVALRSAMQGLPATLENYRAQVAAIKAQLGATPTLGPEAFGIQGAAEPGAGQPSLAFATLMAAQQRGLAGGQDPIQARLDAARQQQAEQYARLNAAAEREYAAEQRVAAAEEARAQRVEAGFQRQVAAQGTTQQLRPEDDPQVQARLYAARQQQQRQFDQLIQQRARQIGPGGAIPGALDAPPEVTQRLRDAADATRDIGNQSGVSTMSLLRFTGALAGVSSSGTHGSDVGRP